MIRFDDWYFLLLIPVAVYLFWFFKKKRGLKFSSVKLLRKTSSGKTIKHIIGKILVLCGVVLALTALARPQTTLKTDFIRKQGIDIVMVLDVSGSMESVDFEPNRLEVARKTIDDFIAERTNDRICLTVFAGTAFTRIPLTLDHNIVRESLANVSFTSVNQNGTAIGMAISVGVNRLKKSDASSRIMILVTDGANNAGSIDPITASGLAKDLGVKIYTIGVGSDVTLIPREDIFGRIYNERSEGDLDEGLLTQIADMTGGQYFRAMDSQALGQVFDAINRLEKSDFNDDNFKEYNELAFPFMIAALVLLTAGIILGKYCFIHIP